MLPKPHARSADDLRFYVDEDILGVGYGLMWLRPDVTTCGQPPFADQLPRGILDPEWVPIVASLGLIAITNNYKIRKTPTEARTAVASGARIIGLAGKVAQRSSWDRVSLLMRHWSAIEKFIADHPDGPWWLAVSQTEARPRQYLV